MQAYRGPITKDTLHFLYSTGAITKQTYVFTEGLTPTRQWVRIRKVDWLLSDVEKPMASSRKRSAGSAKPAKDPTPRRGSADKPAAEQPAAKEAQPPQAGSAAKPVSQSSSRSSASPGPFAKMASDKKANDANGADALDDVPTPDNAPVVATPRHSNISMAPANFQTGSPTSHSSGWGATSMTGGAAGALAGQKLSVKLNECYRALDPSHAPGKGKRNAWFASKGKPAQTTPSSSFGQPLDGSSKLSREGVPDLLEQLRKVLLKGKGYRIEGIFRVSPATSALKASRMLAENGQVDQITDLESAAQLIKIWFRELPTSILGDCVDGIVDGEYATGPECDAALQQLPEVNRQTIYWLLELITDICRYESENRMTAQSMVIVFAPNLICPPDSLDPLSALEVNKRVVQFMEMLFSHYNETGGPATRIGRIGASPSMVAGTRA